jgi:hypothetical protein
MDIKNHDLYVVDIIIPSIGVSLSNLLANLNIVELLNPNELGIIIMDNIYTN